MGLHPSSSQFSGKSGVGLIVTVHRGSYKRNPTQTCKRLPVPHICSFGTSKHTGAIREGQVSEVRDSEMGEDGALVNAYGLSNFLSHPTATLLLTSSSYPLFSTDFKRCHHSLYLGLGETEAKRQAACRYLFRCEFEAGEIDKIRKETNGNFTLGTTDLQMKSAKCLDIM